MFDLKNKVALITGAGKGMGKVHAITLSSLGAKVMVTSRNEEDCRAVVNQIREAGGEAAAFPMDVTRMVDIQAAIEETVRLFNRLDILVNNAGISSVKPAFEITEEEWDRMLSVNLKGQFFVAQYAAKEMAKNKWGRIINISSISGAAVGATYRAHYAASKAGIIGMTRTLAIEWAPLGITVNALAPTLVDTPMTAVAPRNVIEARIARVPLKRICRPEEVAAAAAFLASEEAGYITGTTIYVDGGRLAYDFL